MRIFKISGLTILITGIILIIMSLSYPRYTNENEYFDKYYSLSGNNASEQFFKLREQYLTPKFDLEDFGLTFFITGTVLLLIGFLGFDRIKTPSKKIYIILIGVFAAIITVIGYVGDIYWGVYRDDYPHWADSIAIPLMSVPIFILCFLIWVGLNSIRLKGEFRTNIKISQFGFNNVNYWYLIMVTLTTIINISMIVTGYFWQIISGFFWIYFYLSILIGIREVKLEKIKKTEANSRS